MQRRPFGSPPLPSSRHRNQASDAVAHDNAISSAAAFATIIEQAGDTPGELGLATALFEHSSDILIAVESGGTVRAINPAGVRLLAARYHGEIIGRRFLDLVEIASRPAVEAASGSAASGRTPSIAFALVDLDGTEMSLAASLVPMRFKHKEPMGFLVIGRPAGESADDPEAVAQGRRLQTIGRLTSGVAHDFNNILTIIIGNTELLLEKPGLDQESRKLVETTLTGARSGADLVRMLLAHSRPQPSQTSAFYINELLQEMRDLLHRCLGRRIEFEISADDNLWRVQADRSQLASVLLNLAANARDAMRDGGRLIIETRNVELDQAHSAGDPGIAPGDYVLVVVSDTGEGIAPAALDRVFDPFFTTKEAGKGSGLGLSTAYAFARQSGGHIKIASQQGNGTVVRLYLPRA